MNTLNKLSFFFIWFLVSNTGRQYIFYSFYAKFYYIAFGILLTIYNQEYLCTIQSKCRLIVSIIICVTEVDVQCTYKALQPKKIRKSVKKNIYCKWGSKSCYNNEQLYNKITLARLFDRKCFITVAITSLIYLIMIKLTVDLFWFYSGIF